MIPSIAYVSKDHSEKECLFCLSKFKSKEYITQLACLHIYHKKCDPHKQLTRCPKCRTPIKERLVKQIDSNLLKKMGSYAENYDEMLKEARDFKDKKFDFIKERINNLSLKLIAAFLHDYPVNMRYYAQGKWDLVNPDLTPESVNFLAFYRKIGAFDASSQQSDLVSSYVRQVLLNFIDDERVRNIYDQNTKLTKQTHLDGIEQSHGSAEAPKNNAVQVSRVKRSHIQRPNHEAINLPAQHADDDCGKCIIPVLVIAATIYVFSGVCAALQPRYF
jgi:hypothetical protein